MDFARKILNKYGWKEGEGLGKHNNGIVKPLKASMKFDNAGLGSDQAATDFNNHWWERVFNEAASNVDITAGENGVRVNLKNKDDSVEISTKGYSLKKLKKAKESRSTGDARYDNFLQSATLTKAGDEIENPDKIAVADISVTQYKTLTDEELFQACGGRTAHKGARHGLKLSGKLSRIEQQEQELLARMQERANKKTADEVTSKEVKKNKKKKRKRIDQVPEFPAVLEDAEESSSKEQNHEKAKKKPKNKVAESSVEDGVVLDQKTAEASPKKHKKKKSKYLVPEVADDDDAPREAENLKQKKRKKSKRKSEEATTIPTDVDIGTASHVPKKKLKDEITEETRTKSKKSSKKNKS